MKTSFALAAVLLLSPAFAHAQMSTWTFDSNHSQAGFTIRHLGVSNVHGTISKVSGKLMWDEKDVTKDSVVADLDATTVDTTVAARDTHLKSPDFFDVAKNPTLHFESTKVYREGGALKVMGNLTLAGVTKPVTLDVDGPVAPQKQKDRAGKEFLLSGLSCSTTISRKDFNFGAKYSSPMLGDEVKITIDIEMHSGQ